MGVDVAAGAVWSVSTGDGRSDGVFRGDGGEAVTSKLVSVMVRESRVLDDILEWLNNPELMLQNYGIPHSSHAQVRDSDSTWVWYNDYNMTVWILAGNYISFTIAAGLIRLHMPGVEKSCV